MVDIASLAIKIDTSDLSKGEQALDKLATAGAKAEKAADGVGDAWKSAGDGVGKAGTAAGAAAAGMEKASQAARRQAEIMKQAGLSAGQYDNAMRMLPMQLTDVVTSLASGMPLWMVAIQQGGQVRDSFGGIGSAARAVVGAIGPANLAFGAVATALGAAILAIEKGRNEMAAFNEALILTGGNAGMTSGQLADLAKEMDSMAGVTTSSAASALAKVAGTGRFTGEQIGLVATAAEQMRDATGRSIDETVKEFLRLRADPVKAILDLNEQYHFLTESQLEQIKTLQEQGRQQDAVTASFRAFAGMIDERTPKITENLDWIERAWRGIGGFFSELGDDALSVGRVAGDAERLEQIAQRVAYLRSTISAGSIYEAPGAQEELNRLLAEQEQINTRIEASKKTGLTVDSERKRAEEAWNRMTLRYASDRKKLEEDIKNIRASGMKAGAAQSEIDAQVAAATKEFEDRQAKASRPRSITDDAATRMLAQLRQQEASLQAQLAGNDRLSAAQQAQVQFAQQIADLKEKRILTAEQKSLLANQEAISAQLARNVAIDEELRKREQANELERLRIDILRSSGQREAANEAQFELDYARQRLEYERSGNVEALARLETLKKIREIEAQQSVRPGTVEGVSVAPDMGGLDGAVTGVSGEAARLAEQAAALDQWRTSELEKQQAYLDAKAIGEEVYAERVANIHEQHQQELNELETARQQLSMAQSEALFGGMADLARVFAGEQSNAYRVMFAAQKAYSVASVLLSSADSIGKAWASAPFPANLPAVF